VSAALIALGLLIELAGVYLLALGMYAEGLTWHPFVGLPVMVAGGALALWRGGRADPESGFRAMVRFVRKSLSLPL